jgi:hypothetical protein
MVLFGQIKPKPKDSKAIDGFFRAKRFSSKERREAKSAGNFAQRQQRRRRWKDQRAVSVGSGSLQQQEKNHS